MTPYLSLVLLFVMGFGLAARLEPWRQKWAGGRAQSASALNLLMGDSKRLFANHFFAKADAYFHSGYYPSIFDQAKKESSHMVDASVEAEGEEEHHDEERHEDETGGFLGRPRDWIDRFGRNFFPTTHTHLEKGGDEREILPWLRISAELDPQKVETYTVSSFWLRTKLGKHKEAEQFLREGLRANPDSYDILFELGRIYDENHKDTQTARNIWEMALRKWQTQKDKDLKPNEFSYEQIVAFLFRLEKREGNLKQAIFYLEKLKEVSPYKDAIEKQIQELKNAAPAR